jgi:hypothetical protein
MVQFLTKLFLDNTKKKSVKKKRNIKPIKENEKKRPQNTAL